MEFSLVYPMGVCGVVWGWMLGDVGNFYRVSPLPFHI